MAIYYYKAVRSDGVLLKGHLDALNIRDLESKLESTGCELIDAKEKSRVGFGLKQKIARRDIIDFFVHMEQMFEAGVPVIEALNDFQEGLERSQLKDMVNSLIGKIQSGASLSDAMNDEDKVFSNLTIELIRVGEASGELAAMFGEIKDGLRWQDELITQTKKLLMYPLFVGVVVFGVLCFLMIYLVPQMTGFIASMGGELPFHTKALIAVSDFFVDFWYLIIAMPIVVYALIKIAINKSSDARLLYDKAILRLPTIGPVLKKIILSRFSSNFALLYRSGIGVLEGLEITQGVVANKYVEQEIGFIREQVMEGKRISDAFTQTQLFPQLVLRMIKVGEQTGGLDKSLKNVSYFYDRDVKDSIDKIQGMIEPAMTVFLGVLLGWVMVSVLGPVYDLISNLDI